MEKKYSNETTEREIVECKTTVPGVEVAGGYAGLTILKINTSTGKIPEGNYLAVGSTIIDGPYHDKREETSQETEDGTTTQIMLTLGADVLLERLKEDHEYRMAMAITAATNNVMLILKDETGTTEDDLGMGDEGSDSDS